MSKNIYNDYTKDIFQKDIKYCKGVGLRYADILSKKNIFTLYDLITFFPRTYEDRTKTLKIFEAIKNEDKNSVVFVEVIDSIQKKAFGCGERWSDFMRSSNLRRQTSRWSFFGRKTLFDGKIYERNERKDSMQND